MTDLDFEGCFRIALAAHEGQVDGAGRPYVGHILRVWRNTRPMAVDIDTQKAAVLHDVLGMSEWTLQDLVTHGVGPNVIEALAILSASPDEPGHFQRVSMHPICRSVRIADICDVIDPLRLAVLAPDVASTLRYEGERELGLFGHPGFPDPLLAPGSDVASESAALLVQEIQGLHR